jgi:hypothetical protein
MNTTPEKETTSTSNGKAKGENAPKLVMTKKGAFLWSGQGWYVRAFVKISSLNDDIPLAPRYFKALPEE